MIDKADLDQDGLVSEEEFYAIMTKKVLWGVSDLNSLMKQIIKLKFKLFTNFLVASLPKNSPMKRCIISF